MRVYAWLTAWLYVTTSTYPVAGFAHGMPRGIALGLQTMAKQLTRLRCRAFWMGAVIFCLLLQQMTTVAHACTTPPRMMDPGKAMSMAEPDSARPLHHPMQEAPTDRLLCLMHCAQQSSAPSDAHQITLPPHLLIALPATIAMLPAPSLTRVNLKPEWSWLRAPPRSAIRIFCSLLI